MNNVGTRLYGYCNGYFGRDSYKDKTIIYEGLKWIVVVYDDGIIDSLNFDSKEEKQECIDKWSVEQVYEWEDDVKW